MSLRPVWRLTGALLLAAVTVAALLPLPGPESAPAHTDKLLHALTFAVLTAWFEGFPTSTGARIRTIVALLLYGAAIEGAQALTGYRQADPFDFLADAAGVAGGLLLARAGITGWCERLQLRLAARGRG